MVSEVPIVFTSRFMPCPECGESVERSVAVDHRCSGKRMVDYQMFGLREDVAGFDGRWRRFLHTNGGRFEVWLASRQVRK